MDNKLVNLAEAFTKMAESFLRLVKSIKKAQAACDAVRRQQYKTAGSPFGDSEEGLLLWLASIKKEGSCCEKTPAVLPDLPAADNQDVPGYPDPRFSSIFEDARKRVN